MTRHANLVYAVFYVWIAGVYFSITYGMILAYSVGHTSNRTLMLAIAATGLHFYLGAFQFIWAMHAKNDVVLSIFRMLGGLGSAMVALVSNVVIVLSLALSQEDVLQIIESIRNAGIVGVVLSTLVALGAVGVSIERTVKEALLEMQDEATCS